MSYVAHKQRARLPLLREVSIAANGVLAVGSLIAVENQMRAGGYVTLLVDPEQPNTFALRPHKAYVPGAAKLCEWGNSLHVSARVFVKEHKLPTGRYTATWNEAEKLIVCTHAEGA